MSETVTTQSGYGTEFKDQQLDILGQAQNLHKTGQLGQVAGFTDAQLQGQQAGMNAANTQVNLEGQLAGMAGQTDLSGMRQGALQQAQQQLGLNSAAAGRYNQLGGSRGFVNEQSIANNLAGTFGQIDLQQQQMDLTSTQQALDAQGTGASSMAAIGQGQQKQNQNIADSSYAGLTQLGEMFTSIADKSTSATRTKGK
jgi:hypothetical protein